MDELVSFIICYDDERCLQECIYYIEKLNIPQGITIEIFSIKDAQSLGEAYYAVQEQCKAKYKVYMDQNTLLIHTFFLYDIISTFKKETQVGILAVMGSTVREDNLDCGRALLWREDGVSEVKYQKASKNTKICAASEILLVTQYDLEWAENQIQNFVEQGYEAIVPYQSYNWCLYDCREDKKTGQDREYLYQLMRAEMLHDRESHAVVGTFLQERHLNLQQHVSNAEYQAFAKTMMGYYWEDIFHCKRSRKKYLSANGRVFLDRNRNSVMHIVMAFNHMYVPYAGVMLQSLYENNGLVNIQVHILQIDLTPKDKVQLQKQAKSFSQRIVFYDFNKDLLLEGLKTTEEWSVEAYFRLFMMDILPEHVDRVIYIDVDVIINKPIYDFYYMDMDECEIVGCRDFSLILKDGFVDKRKELFASISQSENFVYINSGVMLVNVELLRRKVQGKDYMKFAREQQGKLLAPDQDIINLMHWQEIGLVDEYRFDFFNACFVGLKAREVEQHVSILHYAGPKPWMPIDINMHAHKIWWEYANRCDIFNK